MEQNVTPSRIAILLYPGVTALDAVGPWEVLSRLPGAEVRFVGKELGPLPTEGGVLKLGVTHTLAETSTPDVLLVPGGTTTPALMVDDEILDWLRYVHAWTTWTASVCTGALILGAAGILKGLPATTHWWKMSVLRILGARPQPDSRIVRSGKVVTAAGVSAGIDLADAGHLSRASEPVRKLAREMMAESMPADQRRLVPRIALRRFLDLVRTGR